MSDIDIQTEMARIDRTVAWVCTLVARIAWVSGQAARLCLVAASGCVGWGIGRGLVWLVG